MALEAVVFQQDPYNHGIVKDFYNLLVENDEENVEEYDDVVRVEPDRVGLTDRARSRRKRLRKTKNGKNKEEVENQRRTHIVVERNRRKQMNDYLSMLRSIMPPSYVQRGDQASIIGGAINFVKELEQLLQSLQAHKRSNQKTSPFSDFFVFPQYSTTMSIESMAEKRSTIADVEVTMVEKHANLKILSKRHPKQLLKIVTGLYSLGLTTLHLNLTTVRDMVVYTFSVKVEDNCELSTVNEIATAVYELVCKIQEEYINFVNEMDICVGPKMIP